MSDKDSAVNTAYRGEAAVSYDEKRFATPQGMLFAELESEQLEETLKMVPVGCRVLEIGCGTGRFSQLVAQRGHTVIATDPSADMLSIASQKCQGLGTIHFQQEEGAKLSFAESTFGLVFAIRVLNQTGSEGYALRMISEMIRVAESGGLILVEFVNRDRPWARRSRDVRLSFRQIEREACGCQVLRRRGVLVFSQSILNRIPSGLIPLWRWAEVAASRALWRWASRGYILLRKT
jgi:SAM-dependent methyltransferase